MLRLTLRSHRDGRVAARILERDGEVWVLDWGDAALVADVARRILSGGSDLRGSLAPTDRRGASVPPIGDLRRSSASRPADPRGPDPERRDAAPTPTERSGARELDWESGDAVAGGAGLLKLLAQHYASLGWLVVADEPGFPRPTPPPSYVEEERDVTDLVPGSRFSLLPTLQPEPDDTTEETRASRDF